MGNKYFDAGALTAESCMIGREQYEMLQNVSECDQVQLEKSWIQWVNLGRRQNGDNHRRTLFLFSRAWADLSKLYSEIERGLYGTIDDQEEFRTRWIAKGLREAAQDPDWTMFEDVIDLYEETKRPVRHTFQTYDPDWDPDNDLKGYIFH